jgi:hypothetical protein
MNTLQLQLIAASLEAVAAAAAGGRIVAATVMQSKKRKEDHRQLPRSNRRKFRHDQALLCINRDYLGDAPLLRVKLKLMFQLSRGEIQVLMEDVMASNIKFFKLTGRDGRCKSSLASRLLLPLKTLPYGVPPHTFIDYFQMSPQYARECCKEFDKAMRSIYMKEFLKLSTATDLKSIVNLHKSFHSIDGMIGSLDCTHIFWKNCPKAWQGSYKGKESKPSIVMESIADYFLFLWHASYGYTGTLNDNTILHLSPFMDRLLLDGTVHELEAEAAVVPFKIKEEQFNKWTDSLTGHSMNLRLKLQWFLSRSRRNSSTKSSSLSMVSTPRTADLSGESKCPLPGKKRSTHRGRKEPGKMWRGLLVCSRTLGNFLTDRSCSMISQTSPTELLLVYSCTTSLSRTESCKRQLP